MKEKKGSSNRFLLIGAIVLVVILTLFSTKLLGQKQATQQASDVTRIEELANKLNNNPSYRDKSSQAYKDARQELCSLTARPSEEIEKAVANIRDFLGSASMEVEFNCSGFEGRDFTKVTEEVYTTPMGYFVVDPKTNYILRMEPQPGSWGQYADGSRWSTPEQQYDYTSRYTMAQAEDIVRKFVSNHKESLGDINLEGMALETGQKDGGGDKINYFFKWTDPNNGSLSMTITSGGQVVIYSNELATR